MISSLGYGGRSSLQDKYFNMDLQVLVFSPVKASVSLGKIVDVNLDQVKSE